MRKLLNAVFALMFLAGFLLLVYPTIADQWNTYRQSRLISSYEETIAVMEPEDFSEEWEKAEAFNDKLAENNIYGDVFAGDGEDLEDTEYWSVLNAAGDGVMGYISIPKIQVKLSIYHGTSEEVLQTGVGHLDGTKLPIGGESTHCVLSAHRGLPSARLFTDIDQLEQGDRFYIHVLDEVLAYEVDLIHDMVDKDDVDALSSALAIVDGEDHVTLFTCTPYGVNTHRLLVRGIRVPYNGEEEPAAPAPAEAVVQAVQNYYMLYLVLGLSVTLLIIVILRCLIRPKRRKNAGGGQADSGKK
ncbi:class C sortase [Lachnoclostridium sp. An131]|uniref:class C sortase n=1 Tax=Lachnoclostridium sp. An131 TaxID=1965555 RepID=UPI000B394480|nr:class C sortase [Lachnoclostridium sp. An131]OUQ24448.1 class C sortase [Lachnoclostridium sp. An131]